MVTSATSNPPFQWRQHPQAEALCLQLLEQACHLNPTLSYLEEKLLSETSSRLFDWVDHLIVGFSTALEDKLLDIGYVLESASADYRVFLHPGAQLPRIVVKDHDESHFGVAVGVESIADFLMVRGLSEAIEGDPYSTYRRCCISVENQCAFWVVERRATGTMEPAYCDDHYLSHYQEAKELWQTRPRSSIKGEEFLIEHTLGLISEIVFLVGQDIAAWIVLEVERSYWQSRNRAAQLQKNRQDHVGMGWANHDHHTFRSSREHFTKLVRLFEILGFFCRERFWAGAEAGWGAQVMENASCGLVLFLDVDLLPGEIEIDFAHHPLPEVQTYGTIGLWCALHGDSIFQAGMHHLEAQFLFENLAGDLAKQGIGMMEPFSNFTYLKQAFTVPEKWCVNTDKVAWLLQKGAITSKQAEIFLKEGAVGSHLENLQRRDGYKGFNQKNVSYIIKKTDPRYQ